MTYKIARFFTLCLLVACDGSVDIVDGGGGAGEGGSASQNMGGASAQGASSPQGGAGQGGVSAQGGASFGGGSAEGAGGPGGGVSDGGSTADSMTEICPATNECGSCVATACPEIWCDCANNNDCLQLFGCTANCPSGPERQACVQDCMSIHQDGISQAILASGCAADPCSASCPAAGDPLTPCEQCTYSTCPDAMNACLSFQACVELYACLSECGPNELSCHNACYDDHPDGIEPLEDVLDCSTGPCDDDCN